MQYTAKSLVYWHYYCY